MSETGDGSSEATPPPAKRTRLDPDVAKYFRGTPADVYVGYLAKALPIIDACAAVGSTLTILAVQDENGTGDVSLKATHDIVGLEKALVARIAEQCCADTPDLFYIDALDLLHVATIADKRHLHSGLLARGVRVDGRLLSPDTVAAAPLGRGWLRCAHQALGPILAACQDKGVRVDFLSTVNCD